MTWQQSPPNILIFRVHAQYERRVLAAVGKRDQRKHFEHGRSRFHPGHALLYRGHVIDRQIIAGRGSRINIEASAMGPDQIRSNVLDGVQDVLLAG